MESKSDLQLLEEQYMALQDEIREMDQKALITMSALANNKKDVPAFDPFRHRQHRQKLQRQLPILESRVRRERLAVLTARRAQKQQELQDLQIDLNASKVIYHEAQKALEKAWTAHAQLEIKAYNLEESLKIDYSDLRDNQRALEKLIREIAGVEDGPSNTDNLLIRN